MEAEGLDFQTRVRLGYLDIARAEPDRVVVVLQQQRPRPVELGHQSVYRRSLAHELGSDRFSGSNVLISKILMTGRNRRNR